MTTFQYPLSVIVLTSPGREGDLRACLTLLCQQDFLPLEVIVVDDGSEQGEAYVKPFEAHLCLRYFWQKNQAKMAALRNWGAQLSRGQGLVFLDSDMLLNPHGLRVYAQLLAEKPARAIGGYIGSHGDFISPSRWLPGHAVWGVDYRFSFVHPDQLWVHQDVLLRPYRYFWSGNFAIRREDFDRVGGFDCQFQNWGLEDIDLGQRLIKAGIALDFCLDAWAEQGIHPPPLSESRQSGNQRFLSSEPSEHRPAQLIYNPRFTQLGEILHRHYFPHSGRKPALAIPASERAQWQFIHLSPESEGP